MSTEGNLDLEEVSELFFTHFNEHYLEPLRQQVELNPELLESVAGFLIMPKKVIIYFTKNHIVLEYEGPDRLDALPTGTGYIEIKVFDYAELSDPFSEIIGFKHSDGTSGFNMPLFKGMVFDDLIMPTNRALDRLIELGWNTGAQDHILSINGGGLALVEGQAARIINGLFFDAPQEGLITRHIKWADCIPIKRIDLGESWRLGYTMENWGRQAVMDSHYNYYVPTEYRLRKLPYVNRFIEFYSAPNRSEVEITEFLSRSEFQFILTMRFGCNMTTSTPASFVVDVKGSSAVLTTLKKKNPKEPAQYGYEYYWQTGGRAPAPRRDWIYALPFEEGRGYKLIQGAGGSFSHAPGSYSENALDWAMPEGEPIKAARGGIVTAAVGYYSSGGLDQGYKSKGNHVIIRHDDGTYAEYYHLRKKGVVVSLGATVSVGDLIGYSGNTGYSGGPHLHFAVFRNLDTQRRETFPLRFRTANGRLIENPKVGDIH